LPYIYFSKEDGNFYNVDRKTLAEKKIPVKIEEDFVYMLLAVPQVNYQGEFFVSKHRESTSDPGQAILAINGESGEIRQIFDQDELAGPFATIHSVSPDQRYIVAVQPLEQIGGPGGRVILYDLLSGKSEATNFVSEGEYLTDDREDMFGVGLPEFNWINSTCVDIGIFGEDRLDSGVRRLDEYRLFCVE